MPRRDTDTYLVLEAQVRELTAPPIVIVGAGQAGFEAAAALREAGHDGAITLVGAEPHAPYERPPLSKQFLAPDADPGPDSVALRPAEFYQRQGIDLVLGAAVTGIDRGRRTVVTSAGERLRYSRLILATGSTPRRLDVPGAGHPDVMALRTLADASALRDRLAAAYLRLVVIGAGFIGLEVAAAARAAGHEVTVVEALDRVIARAVSVPVSRYLTALHRDRGVKILFERRVEAIDADVDGALSAVRLAGGETILADLVVVGIGVTPDTALAEEAGLAVADGIVVDEYLRTEDPWIHAIGDCVRFPSPHTDGPVRLESVQNAVDQARCVADYIRRGAAQATPYEAVPWFWSDQYSDKLQIAGITAGHDRVEIVGDPAEHSFSAYCFAGKRLLGVESVNRPVDHIRGRRQLAQLPARAARAAEVRPESRAA